MTEAKTFLDVFSPPEGTVGHTAVLVAMSAGEEFLDTAMERFTRLRARQRAALGLPQAWLMLDPHASPSRLAVLPPGRVPGLHELHPRRVPRDSLLHAKLALLSFGPTRRGDATRVRLVISTGNFTDASARHQLELLWVLDVALDASAPSDDRDDVAAAADFAQHLLDTRYYAEPAKTGAGAAGWMSGLRDLLTTAREIGKVGREAPRFIHSRREALFGQIQRRFSRGVRQPCNFMLCGSGFYEQPARLAGPKPEVVTSLETIAPFTRGVRRILLVEPSQAGAVAAWAQGGDDDWTVARPHADDARRRTLHAKFIYVGHERSGTVGSGWLYLGSGNLSHRGLMTSGGGANTNLECGVVLPVPQRMDGDDLAHRLFWRSSESPIDDDEWREDGKEEEQLVDGLLVASPILSARVGVDRALTFEWRDDVAPRLRVEVTWLGGDARIVTSAIRVVSLGNEPAPAVIEVHEVGGRGRWTVPVIDPHGRVAWVPARYERWEDALDALLEFPMAPAEVDDEEAEDEGEMGLLAGASVAEPDAPHRYALHAAAAFVERVAALQSVCDPKLLDEWLDHLERVLEGRFPEAMLDAWRAMHLNVFESLNHAPLSPRGMTPTQRVRYERVLLDAARRWRLS